MGGTKLERFLLKNHYTPRISMNFEKSCSGELSKIGHYFNDKMILKLMISRIVKNRNGAPKLVFSIEKSQKDLFDFCCRKLTL